MEWMEELQTRPLDSRKRYAIRVLCSLLSSWFSSDRKQNAATSAAPGSRALALLRKGFGRILTAGKRPAQGPPKIRWTDSGRSYVRRTGKGNRNLRKEDTEIGSSSQARSRTDSAWCGEQLQALRALSDFCERRKGQPDSRHRRKRVRGSQSVLWGFDGGARASRGDEGSESAAGNWHDVRNAARPGMGTGRRDLRAVSGGNGAVRVQWNGSDHACVPDCTRCNWTRQDCQI